MTLRTPRPGWSEEGPARWRDNVCALIPRCLRSAAVMAGEVIGVGVSGMVPTVVLLEARGAVLRPSIQQNDARAVHEIQYFGNERIPRTSCTARGVPLPSRAWDRSSSGSAVMNPRSSPTLGGRGGPTTSSSTGSRAC